MVAYMKRYIWLLIIFGALEIAIALYLSSWRHVFWDAVETRELFLFWQQLGIFAIVACCFCIIVAYSNYVATLCAIKWREVLNIKAMQTLHLSYENINQRIQEDCKEYPSLIITIYFGFLKALAYVVVFSISVIFNYSWIYLIILFVYTIISTIVARYIANPLIALNYSSQRVEATYRNEIHIDNFDICIGVMKVLAAKTKRLQYFQTLYGQVGVIIPLLIAAPAYFSGAMTLGGLMQANNSMATILDNSSYGVNIFDQYNKLLSCKKRLKEINVI
jgi:putative ATP-binding cassette transporter